MDKDLWSSIGASAEALEKLQEYAALTEKWTAKINLIAKASVSDIWSRHIEDSARVMLNMPANPRIWADFGSGGGFPGIVVAVLLQDRGLDTQVVLVESDQRKSAFLMQAARNLSLTTRILAERAESIAPIGADVISARALTALDGLCAIIERHGSENCQAIFPKGETWPQEVALARKNWIFDLEAAENPGHKGSATLILRNLRRASRDALA